MPELPEVEFARKQAEAQAAGRVIERAWCADDDIVFEGATPRKVQRHLKGNRVVAARRKGKQMWLELERGPHLMLHFGMTGQFRFPDDDPLQLEGSAKKIDRSWPPRFWKLRLRFEDGGELVMTNARRLGRIRLADDPEQSPPIAALGFDPLLEMPSAKAFAARLQGKRVTLKGLLLDQKFAAGVGNWIADEVLYQARLDPRRRVSDLSAEEIERMRRKLRDIIKKAVAVDARKDRFPKTWLFHHRWGKERDAQTARGERVAYLTVAGRTTAWVPEVQY